MATKTLLTTEQYATLEEPAGVRYELSEGELIVTPSANFFHNKNRDRLNARLQAFLEANPVGEVVSEMDLSLAADVVRRPDIAFIRNERFQGVDLAHVPLPMAPDLVIEIVSEFDRAADLNLKIEQYLQAGVAAVWVLYPATRAAHRYVAGKRDPKVLSARAGDRFEEPELLPGFALPIAEILR